MNKTKKTILIRAMIILFSFKSPKSQLTHMNYVLKIDVKTNKKNY